ncbi:hypothetical protein RhiirA5_358003 [Rhizophagus irregularis]|uniref:Uncharacterized protein n=1 Tax=Rhizophagus irregularis TaxID=588596 RepID=A0A2I1EN42_9GLOM|nr:hypothetical protein RhiirA5_358003 [Rhizophagus irregularis]PKC61667.1 hypothetical protein RhiirA1_424640 [Rhizophagus irregularis]PKY23551.1 hypothetical protein RhiirB3_411985 [Rhizophagus irregularis]
MFLRDLRSQPTNLEKVKRFEDGLIENHNDNNDDGQSIKRKKLYEDEGDYIKREIRYRYEA